MYKILAVDDEYMILEGLKFLLPWNDLGFEFVKTARTAMEALDYLADNHVDLVISDITMPEMTGIEMINTAQQQGKKFMSIFLSGYQEFDYVKEGIRLGVKDYLLKPVDKEELAEIVLKIKKELDELAQRQNQEHLIRENQLIRWINDELNESEFERLLLDFHISGKGPFTTLKIQGNQDELLSIIEFTQKFGQPLVISGGIQQHNQLLIIFIGKASALNTYLSNIRRKYEKSIQIYVGETIIDWENLYESYSRVSQLEEIRNFYPDLLPNFSNGIDSELVRDDFSFLSFNKSLMIGDTKTISQELDSIFERVVNQQVPPENARYITFLLFNDMFRQYPTISREVYEETIEKIRSSNTVYELKRLLEELLNGAAYQGEDTHFSSLTKSVIEIIQKNYREELTLKSVADQLHVNAVYLGQVFKKEIRYSFSQYLNQIRIKRAQYLLLNSNFNINEISEEIGYNNTNYFSKMFKKLNGITPKEFREEYKDGYTEL